MADAQPVDYNQDGWWDKIPAVDDWPDRLERDPELEPTPEALVELGELEEALNARAQEPDVQAFINDPTRSE